MARQCTPYWNQFKTQTSNRTEPRRKGREKSTEATTPGYTRPSPLAACSTWPWWRAKRRRGPLPGTRASCPRLRVGTCGTRAPCRCRRPPGLRPPTWQLVYGGGAPTHDGARLFRERHFFFDVTPLVLTATMAARFLFDFSFRMGFCEFFLYYE